MKFTPAELFKMFNLKDPKDKEASELYANQIIRWIC